MQILCFKQEEAAMPDEAELASERQVFDKGSDADDYERRVARDVVAMLLETRADARQVLRLVDAMLNVKLPGEDQHPSDAAKR
jgi:hypothetical protein